MSDGDSDSDSDCDSDSDYWQTSQIYKQNVTDSDFWPLAKKIRQTPSIIIKKSFIVNIFKTNNNKTLVNKTFL